MKALRPNLFKALLFPRLSHLSALAVATFILTLLGPHPVMAQTVETFGDLMCSVAVNIVPYLDVMNMLAYVAGTYFLIQAVLHLRNHYDNPGQYPNHKTAALFFGSAALLSLPTIVSTLIDTLFNFSGGATNAGLTACSVTESTTSGAVTPDVMLQNLIANVKDPLLFLTSAIAILLGLFLIVRGLMRASKYGTDPRTHSITNITSSLIIGAILLVVGQSVGTIMESVFGTSTMSTSSVLNWANLNNSFGETTGFQNGIKAVLTFVQVIGFISFVRGWNIIRLAVEGSGQATVPQGITHIVGGVMAINIYAFIQMMDKTFGTSFFT